MFGKIGLDCLILVLIVFWVVEGELVNEDVVIGLVNFFSVWLRIIGLLGWIVDIEIKKFLKLCNCYNIDKVGGYIYMEGFLFVYVIYCDVNLC